MIVAVDPGKVTGVAKWRRDRPAEIDSLQQPCWDAVATVHHLMTNGLTAVVCESYVISSQTLRKTRGENWSLESIGALRYLAGLFDIPFILQTPADAKSFVTDQKLHAAGWYQPSTGGHANDAARHLMLYLARANADVFRRVAAGW